MNARGAGEPERVTVVETQANFFSLLGVQPMLGRTFVAGEDQAGKNRVVLLSYGFWESHFGGQRDTIGKSMELNGAAYEIVGVTPVWYRIPGAAAATLTPMPSTGHLPGLDAPGRPVGVTHPDPSSWTLVTQARSPQVLRLRLTDVPGWRATIDGRPLPLQQFAGIMLQTEVPAGTHTVELRYWPATFSAGLLLAGGAVVGLLAAVVVPAIRGRLRSRSTS